MGERGRKKNGTKISAAPRGSAGKTSQWDCKTWTLLVVPCLLWSTLPRMDDLLYLASFIMGQAMYYSINHMRGLLFLCFLVLFIWTKNVLIHWIHCKVMTMDFIRTLMYLMLSVLTSLALLMGVWWPLWDCYDCALAKMRPWIRDRLIYYKDAIFIMTAGSMAISSASQTDLFLKPHRISDSGVPFMLGKIADKSSKLMRKAFKHICVIMEANWRTLTQLKGNNKRSGFDMTNYVTGWACGDSDSGGKPKCDKRAHLARSPYPRRVLVTSLRQESDNKEDQPLCPSKKFPYISGFPWWYNKTQFMPPDFPHKKAEESGASVKKQTAKASNLMSPPNCKIAKCAASCSRPKEQITKMTRSRTRARGTVFATSHLSY